MTIPSLRDFQAKGWFLSQEGLNRIIAENENLKSIEDYIACAKNMDLCHLTTIPALKEESELSSPFILQVVDIKRKKLTAAATKASGGLTITFTDGQNQYKAAEILGKVECIKPYTAPGTKYLVIKPIEIKDQILVLGPGMLKEEGGYVKELVSNWKKAKKLAKKPLKKTVTAPQVDKTVEEKDTNVEEKDTNVKENNTKRKPKRTVKKKKKSQQPENTTNNKEQEKKEDLPSSSRVPTPALSETSQKKKKHRKPKANKKVTVPVEEDDSTQKSTNQEVEKEQSPIIEEPVIKETEEQPLVEEEEKPATETISSSSDISPVSENKSNNSNNNRLVHHPLPQPHVLAPPPLPYPHPQQQEYYYQGQPTMFMDYSMMVPVPMYHQPYMPPPYMQHVYYVTTDQQQQHQQPPPHHYYTYQPHYTQIYDEGCYGPPYYHPHP